MVYIRLFIYVSMTFVEGMLLAQQAKCDAISDSYKVHNLATTCFSNSPCAKICFLICGHPNDILCVQKKKS